jgi:hypothetical protein
VAYSGFVAVFAWYSVYLLDVAFGTQVYGFWSLNNVKHPIRGAIRHKAYILSLMRKFNASVYTLVLVMAIFLMFSRVTHADSVFSGCDVSYVGGSYSGGDLFCGGQNYPQSLIADLTLYGVQYDVLSVTNNDPLYLKVEGTVSSDGCYLLSSLSSGTGIQDFYLQSPILLHSGDQPILRPRRDSSCSYGWESFLLVGGDGGFAAGQFLWAAGTFLDTKTRIIDLQPANASTTGNDVHFRFEYFISPDDFNLSEHLGVKIYLHNIDQNVLLAGALSPADIVLYDDFATASGDFVIATTTYLADGNYRLYAQLQKNVGNILGLEIFTGCGSLSSADCIYASTQFIVNQGTFIGNISQNSFDQVGIIFASSSATSTAALGKTCVPWSGSFDTLYCLSYLFIPDAGHLNDTLINFRDNVSTHFPLGYVTDFIVILASTTASSLPVIDATIPLGIGGTGSHIHLQLANVLDPILYATTSQFLNASASSTGTLYSITSYYWNMIVYAFAGFYIIARIFGSHLHPGRLFYHQKS